MKCKVWAMVYLLATFQTFRKFCSKFSVIYRILIGQIEWCWSRTPNAMSGPKNGLLGTIWATYRNLTPIKARDKTLK